MAEKCPVVTSKDWKLLVSQMGGDKIGEDRAWYTWMAHNDEYPPTLQTTSSLKKEIGMKNGISDAQVKALGQRLRIYNKNNGTSHSFTTTRIGQADLYIPELRISYLSQEAEDVRAREISNKLKNADFNDVKVLGVDKGTQGNLFSDSGALKSFLHTITTPLPGETKEQMAARKLAYETAYRKYVYTDKIPVELQYSVAAHLAGITLDIVAPQLTGNQKVELYYRDPKSGKMYLNVRKNLEATYAALSAKEELTDDEKAQFNLLKDILNEPGVWESFQEGIVRVLRSKKYKFVKGGVTAEVKEDGLDEDVPDEDFEPADDLGKTDVQENEGAKHDVLRNWLTIPNKELMSTAMRTFLSSIKSDQESLLTLSVPAMQVGGVDVTPRIDYNYNYVNEDVIIGAVNAAVVGDTTLEEMIRDLRYTAMALPDRKYLAAVADKLNKADAEIQNQFVNKFNQQQAIFLVHRYDKKPSSLANYEDEYGETAVITGVDDKGKMVWEFAPKVIDANRQAASTNMRVKAKEDFYYSNDMTGDIVPEEIKAPIYAAYTQFQKDVKAFVRESDGTIKDVEGLTKALEKLLNLINIDISSDAIRRFMIGTVDRPVRFSGSSSFSVFNSTYGDLYNLFTPFGKVGEILDINDIYGKPGALKLFNTEALFQELYYNTSVVNAQNKRVWGYSAPNPLSGEFYKLQKGMEAGTGDHLADIIADPFRSKSVLLDKFAALSKTGQERFIENFKYSIVNTLRSGNSLGKDLSDTHEREFILTQLIAMTANTVNDGIGNTWSFKFLTTPSEKTTMYTIQTPDYKVEWSKGAPIVGQSTINNFYRYFTAEYDRIMLYQNASEADRQTIDSLRNTESRLFYWFPGLNLKGPENPLWKDGKLVEIEYDEDGDPVGPVADYVRNEIRNQVLTDINKTREQWMKIGLMFSTVNPEGVRRSNMAIGLSSQYREKVNSSISLKNKLAALKKNPDGLDAESLKEELQELYKDSHANLSEYLLHEYAINYQLHNMEMQILFLGDPADFLKSQSMKMSNRPGLFESNDISMWRDYTEGIRTNLVKRMAGIQASGTVGAVYPAHKTINTIVLEDTPFFSKTIAEYRRVLDGDKEEEGEELESKKFTSIDHMDGQEITSAQEDLLVRLLSGKLSESRYNAILGKVNGANKDIKELGYITDENQFSPEEKDVFQAQKPVMFSLVPLRLSESVKFKATYYKPSSFGLYPQFTVGLEIDKMRAALYELELNGVRVDRMPALSAAKLGAKAPVKGIFLQDPDTGKVTINGAALGALTEANIDYIPRENLRIQLEVPYEEEKESITMASQQIILIFNEIPDITFDGGSVANFLPEFKGKSVTGQQLKDLHEETFKKLLDLSKKEILDKIGAVENRNGSYHFKNLIKLRSVIYDQALMQGYDMPSLEGLQLTPDNKEFIIPLSFSSNASRYEKLLLSLVKKAVLQKIHGRSLILATETGFTPHQDNKLPKEEEAKVLEGKDAEEYIKKNQTAIIFVPYDKETGTGYNEELGLQAARPNPNNPDEVLPHQVLISFKYKDAKGNPLDIKKFITTDAKGRQILNTAMMDKDTLRILGIRIPTQGHPSIGSIEIVGFLPHGMGDLIIAPMDFTKIFGSDFDIDKLYGYMYNYTYSDKDGIRRYKMPVNSGINELDLFSEGPVIEDIPDSEDSPDKKMLQNKLQDIYHVIALNTEVWKKAVIGINEGRLTEIANKIKNHKRGVAPRYYSPASEQFKVKEYFDNKDGQTGVSIYSAMNTFATVIEGKKLKLAKYEVVGEGKIEKVENPLRIVPNGDGQTAVEFVELSGAKGHNRIISAWQSASVDSVKLDIIAWINTNETTMGVSGVMAMLADDSEKHEVKDNPSDDKGKMLPLLNEDFIVYFLMQPSVVGYVEALSTGNDGISGRIANFEAATLDKQIEAAKKSLEELVGDDVEGALEGFPGFNLDKLKKNVFNPDTNDLEYRMYQAATLIKFKELLANANDVRSLQYLLNAHSKGTSGSIDEALYKRRRLDHLLESPNDFSGPRGTPSLLNVEAIFENANGTQTLAGKEANMGIDLPIELFANNNILSSGSPTTETMIVSLSDLTNQDADKYSHRFGSLVNKALLSYMQARNSFEVQEPGSTITEDKEILLFGDEEEQSLGAALEVFKASDEYQEATILKPLIESVKIRTKGEAKFVEFQAYTGLINPTEEIIQSLEYLRRVNSDLFDKLVRYVLLMQFQSSPVSLRQFIAPFYIQGIGLASRFREISAEMGTRNGTSTGAGNLRRKMAYGRMVTYFEEQFLQHHPSEAIQADEEHITYTSKAGVTNKFFVDITKYNDYSLVHAEEMSDELSPEDQAKYGVISKYASPYLSVYDRTADKYRLYKILEAKKGSPGTFVYQEIATLGAYNLEEYDYDATYTKDSLLPENNPKNTEAKVKKVKEVSPEKPTGITTDTISKGGNVKVVVDPWKSLKYYESGDALVALRNTARPTSNWGNPFSRKDKTNSKEYGIKETTAAHVQAFRDWLSPENPFPELEPERRQWILDEIASGKWKGATILYYKELNEPSHATVLDELINGYKQAQPSISVKPKGKQVANGIYVNQEGLTPEEELELFNIIKPVLEAQAVRSNKGKSAPKMAGLNLNWDYVSNRRGKQTRVNVGESLIPNDTYGWFSSSFNGQKLYPITVRLVELMTKATGIDVTDYDGAIINIYNSNSFIGNHPDIDESKTAEKYPVVVVNIGGKGNIVLGTNAKNVSIDLKSGAGYIFGHQGKNRTIPHSTYAAPIEGTLPAITTKMDGETIPAGSYRISVTMRRVMPLKADMPSEPSVVTGSTQPSNSVKAIPLNKSQRFTRESVEKDTDYMYLFTDNAGRTSGSGTINPNSWYAKKYGANNKYAEKTQAVARGLENVYPITTMVDDKRTQWKDAQFDKYKKIIDDEIATIKEALPKYKGMKFGAEMPFGKGAISNMKDDAPKIWAYLNTKLAEIGIDNTGESPKAITTKATLFDAEVGDLGNPQYKNKPEFNKLPGKSAVPTMTYAGIGSRETPPEVLKQLTALAKELEALGYTANTGDADGADKAIREGATKKNVSAAADATERTKKIAREIHPSPAAVDKLVSKKTGKSIADYAWGLHARNTNQIFGKDLATPVDFVIAWTPDALTDYKDRTIETGGTGQAIDMASRKGIPVINLADPAWRQKLDEILGVKPNSKPLIVSQIAPVVDNSTGVLGNILSKYFKADLNGTGEQIVTEILETTASDRNLDNPYFKELAQLLIDVNKATGFLKDIKFVTSSDEKGGDFYEESTHTVSISTSHKAEEIPYIILHELIHAASVSNLTGEAGLQLRARINRVIAALETDAAISAAISYYGLGGKVGVNAEGQSVEIDVPYIKGKLAALRAGKIIAYSSEAERRIIGPLIDFKEFVAMTLGDTEVQRFMNTMQYQDYKGDKTTSILDRLKEVFNLFFTKLASLLGIKIGKDSVLKSAVSLSMEALSTLKTEYETEADVKAKVSSEKSFDPEDKNLRPGSVVKYAGARYIYWNTNLSGKAQLIGENGTKFSGTPSPDKLEVLGGYKTALYNGKEYIVTDSGNVFSAATGKLVYDGKDDSSKAQKKKITDEAFGRSDISHLVGISPTPGVVNTPQDTKIPETRFPDYYKTQIEAYYREKEIANNEYKQSKKTAADKTKLDTILRSAQNKITRAEKILETMSTTGFKLSQFYNEAEAELVEMRRIINSSPTLSIEEYSQIASTFEYFNILYTTINGAYNQTVETKEAGAVTYVTQELFNKVKKFHADAISMRADLVDGALKAYVAEYNNKNSAKMTVQDILTTGKSTSISLETLELAVANSALAASVGRICSEMVSATNSALQSGLVIDEDAANKFLQYYKFTDILQFDTYLDQYGLTKTDKNFLGRYKGDYFRMRTRIFEEGFKKKIPGEAGKFIARELKKIAHSIDVRYLFPDEYNTEMQFYLGTSNNKVETTSHDTYKKVLLNLYMKQYAGYNTDYIEDRLDEVIQQATDRLAEYLLKKQDEEARIAALTKPDDEKKMDMLDWLAENSPFVLLNERFGLEKTKGAILDAPEFVGAKYTRAETRTNAAGVAKTQRWFVQHSARSKKAERNVIKKANRFYENGSVTGFINDKFLDMEQEHFKKLRDKKAFIAAGNQAAADALDAVPSLYEFWKWVSDRQREYLSTIPYYLRSNIEFTSMLDIETPIDQEYENKSEKALQLFDIPHLTYDRALEGLKNFWLAPELLTLAWDKGAQTVARRTQKEDSDRIDLLRNDTRRNFNPLSLNNTLNKQGLGRLKTDNLRTYLAGLRTMAVTFKAKNEAISLARLGEFVYKESVPIGEGNRSKAEKAEADLLKWTINNKFYNLDSETPDKVLTDSKSKLFWLLSPKWKLTSREREKYTALELRIEELTARYALKLSPQEIALLDIEIKYLTEALDRITREVTTKTLYKTTIALPVRATLMVAAPVGRASDFLASTVYGTLREGRDGRLYSMKAGLEALGIVSRILLPKAVGTGVFLFGAASLNPVVALAGVTMRTAAGMYNETYRRPEYIKLALFGQMMGATRQAHMTSDDYVTTASLVKSVGEELKDTVSVLKPFGFISEVETINKTVPYLAVALHTKVEDLMGFKRPLYDAFILDNTDHLVWNEAEFGPQQDLGYDLVYGPNMIKAKAAMRVASTHSNGNYQDEDTLKIDSDWRKEGLAILQRYLLQFVNARLASPYTNANVEIQYMGSTYAFIQSIINSGKYKGNPAYEAALRQYKFGVAWITAMVGLGLTTLLLSGGDDDDDEGWWYYMMMFANTIIMRNFLNEIVLVDPTALKRKSAIGIHPVLQLGYDYFRVGEAFVDYAIKGDEMDKDELIQNNLYPYSVNEYVYTHPITGKKVYNRFRSPVMPEVSRIKFRASKVIPGLRQTRTVPKVFKPIKQGNLSWWLYEVLGGDN